MAMIRVSTVLSVNARIDYERETRKTAHISRPYRKLDRVTARERDALVGYFERWLDRQCLILLEEWSPVSRMVQ
jgi:hypothetical protein